MTSLELTQAMLEVAVFIVFPMVLATIWISHD